MFAFQFKHVWMSLWLLLWCLLLTLLCMWTKWHFYLSNRVFIESEVIKAIAAAYVSTGKFKNKGFQVMHIPWYLSSLIALEFSSRSNQYFTEILSYFSSKIFGRELWMRIYFDKYFKIQYVRIQSTQLLEKLQLQHNTWTCAYSTILMCRPLSLH